LFHYLIKIAPGTSARSDFIYSLAAPPDARNSAQNAATASSQTIAIKSHSRLVIAHHPSPNVPRLVTVVQLIVVEASGLLPGEGTVKAAMRADKLSLLVS